MRILWLSHFLPFPATGHGALQRSHHLLRQAALRHAVDLIALDPDADIDNAHAAERELGAVLASVRIHPFRLGRSQKALAALRSVVDGSSYWHRAFWSEAMAESIRIAVREKTFDLVHIDSILLARYIPLCGDTPVALTHHNVESHLLRRRADASPSLVQRAFFSAESGKVEALENALAPRAAVNLMVSELDAERLQSLSASAQVVSVPNGVDTTFFQSLPGVRPIPNSLVFAGGMNWFPNRDAMEWMATDIWPALTQVQPHSHLSVIGRQPPAILRELASVDERVVVTGFVDDVRPHISRSAVYICPIRVGGGTRLKILDALAMGRPLVSTSIGVEGLGLTPDIHYLLADSVDDFIQQIGRLSDDPSLSLSLAAAGRQFVEATYAWEVVGKVLHKAYCDAANRTKYAAVPADVT